MKWMIASDIHGSASSCIALLEQYQKEGAQKLILLGDLLYHGPRNDLPDEYRPKEVITRLNQVKNELLCVRGNCEAEVDQMVLEFPVMADYALLWIDGLTIFAVHGHHYNQDQLRLMAEAMKEQCQKNDVMFAGMEIAAQPVNYGTEEYHINVTVTGVPAASLAAAVSSSLSAARSLAR